MIKNNSFEHIFTGKILYNELDFLNKSLPLQNQLDSLKEDLLQVESRDGSYLLDIGWYPEFDLDGTFKIQVIKKYDWENPVYSENFSDFHSLRIAINKCKLLYRF